MKDQYFAALKFKQVANAVLLFFAMTFFLQNATGQSLYFKYLGRNSTSEDMVSSYMGNITLNKDGGHTLVASTTYGSGTEDMYVIRMDKDGNKMWSKAIGTSNYEYGSGLAQTSDSGFIVVGSYNMVLGNSAIIVTKLNKNGGHVWSRTIGTGALPANGWDVVIEPVTENIYVLGTVYNESLAYWNYDATLTKFDANGNMIWSKFIGTAGYELVYAMTLLKNGNLAVTGSGVLFCADTSGNVLWSRSLQQNDSWDIQSTPDSGCVISGRYTFYSPSPDEEFIIEKIDKSGNLVWYRRIGDLANSSTTQQGVSCYVANDATIYMIGWGYGSPNGSGDLYGMLIKLSSAGNLIWSRAIDIAGATTVACKVVASGIAGGINISGYTLSPNPNYWNIFNANVDSSGYLGCIISPFAMSVHSTVGTISSTALTSKTGYTAAAVVPSMMNEGNDTISVCSAPAPLPVELFSFSVQNKNNVNHLTWMTASEINNAYFDVERSVNATDFEKIGTDAGNANSNQPIEYFFDDRNFRTGINYYRLKQVDINGNYSYSGIIAIKNNLSGDDIFNIYPNPAQDFISLDYPGESIITDIQIYNSLGTKIIASSTKNKIDISTVPPGVYSVVLTTGSKVFIKRFLKE